MVLFDFRLCIYNIDAGKIARINLTRQLRSIDFPDKLELFVEFEEKKTSSQNKRKFGM